MIKLGVRSQPTCTQKGIWLANNGTLIFKGATVLGNGCQIEIKAGATLVIGSNTGITGDTIINCHQNITLGDFFSCAWNVSICDTDFHECFHIIEDKKQLIKVCKPITIGNFVWVCQNVTILKGTIIPDWCTIAANSMTKGDYHAEKYSLIAGIPAKTITYKLQRKDLNAIKDIEDFEITKGIKVFG